MRCQSRGVVAIELAQDTLTITRQNRLLLNIYLAEIVEYLFRYDFLDFVVI